MQPLVVLTRSDKIESIHKGYICISDSQKHPKYCIGNPDSPVYLRSSAKPLQAVALVSSGALERFNITEEEVAIICASHSGEDFHRHTVKSILNKAGLSEQNLSCGVANPYNPDSLNQLIKSGQRPSQLYNCCSGKHAGMLLLCKYYGYPIKEYTEPNHPVQRLILQTLAELLDCSENALYRGIDGCGVPTYRMSVKQAAFLYSLLAQGARGSGRYKDCFQLIQQAMCKYPRMINGDKEFCTDLITHSEGKVLGKVGAEGIYCLAIPEEEMGVCIKVADGNERAVYPVAVHVMKQLGILGENTLKKLEQWAYPPIKNHKGNLVGYTIPVFDISKDSIFQHIQIGDHFKFEGDLHESSGSSYQK